MQPVYGPSTPSPYQQFYDVTTGMPTHPQIEEPEKDERYVGYASHLSRSNSAHLLSPHEDPYSPFFPSTMYGSPTLSLQHQYETLMGRSQSKSPSNEFVATPPHEVYPPPEVKDEVGGAAKLPTPRRAARKGKQRAAGANTQERGGALPHEGELTQQTHATPKRQSARQQPTSQTPQTEPRRQLHQSRSPSQPTFIVDLLGHQDRVIVVKSQMELTEGDYVVFEGDRGIDMGRVHRVSNVSSRPDVQRPSSLPMIIRNGTTDEIKMWTKDLVEEAAAAVAVCQEAVDRLGIDLVITAASYQMDRQKISFYYDTNAARVDFRRLLSLMYTRYRCRIWLVRNS